jgi:hypothetical protein
MNPTLSVLSIDLLLLLRLCLAFFWGFAWAGYLQFTRHGQFLVLKRTWITVVIGVGVDLIIAYAADYWTVVLVIGISSFGIIFRSLWNESQGEEDPNANSFKLKYALEDGIAVCNDLIANLTEMLSSGSLAELSYQLSLVHHLHSVLLAARRGDNPPKNAALKKRGSK